MAAAPRWTDLALRRGSQDREELNVVQALAIEPLEGLLILASPEPAEHLGLPLGSNTRGTASCPSLEQCCAESTSASCSRTASPVPPRLRSARTIEVLRASASVGRRSCDRSRGGSSLVRRTLRP